MKTIAFAIALSSAAMVASAAELSTNTIAAPATSLWTKAGPISSQSSNAPPATDMETGKVGERLDLSTAVTLKPRPAGGPVWSLFNPLAPMPLEPSTRWATRAPWMAAAERTGKAPSAVEVRHESHFGVVVCSR